MKNEEEIRLELQRCEEQMKGYESVLSSPFGNSLTKRSNKNILSMREQLFERAFALRWVLGEYERKPKKTNTIV